MIVAVPPATGDEIVNVLPAVRVPLTTSEVSDAQGGSLVIIASMFPVTTPLEIWSAPYNPLTGIVELKFVAVIPQSSMVGAEELVGDEPQARRAASGNKRRKRGPGCMSGIVRRGVGGGNGKLGWNPNHAAKNAA